MVAHAHTIFGQTTLFSINSFLHNFTTILTEISLYTTCTLTNWMKWKWIMIVCGMVFIYVDTNCTNQINTSCVCVLILLLVNCINRFWCFQFIGTYITRTCTHIFSMYHFVWTNFCWFTPVSFIALFDDHWIRYEWLSITTITIIILKVVKYRAIEVIHQRIKKMHWC